jgi:hypothetical protein
MGGVKKARFESEDLKKDNPHKPSFLCPNSHFISFKLFFDFNSINDIKLTVEKIF